MEPHKPSILPGLITLYATQMLERFSYYGMRALLVLFMVDSAQGGLGLESAEALSIYSGLNWGGILVLIPLALLTDFLLKQKNSLILGCALSTAGFAMLIPGTYFTTLVGLGLVVLGTGFVRPSIPVLIGRGFHKTDSKRDGAMLLNYSLINAGAMAAPLIIGTVGEKFGWGIGFGIAAGAMLVGTIVAILARFAVEEVETNNITLPEAPKEQAFGEFEEPLTPVIPPPVPQPFPIERWLLIGIIMGVLTFFWWGYEQTLGGVMNQLYSLPPVGEGFLNIKTLTSFSPGFSLFFTLGLGLLWLFVRTGSTLLKMGIGCAIFAISSILVVLILMSPSGWLILIVLFMLLQALAESFLSPLAQSFLTRLTPVKFSSTVMAIFFAVPLGFSHLINAFTSDFISPESLFPPLLIIGLFLGFALLFFLARKPMENLGKGIT